ncbi:hypothetical protein EV122DRAFT_203764 [Schizophyllum commune]
MHPLENALKEARAVANGQIHRTSFVPTEEDAHLIRLKAQTLRNLDNEIVKNIQYLFNQRRAIHMQLQAHVSLLSARRRLPLELLSEIFLLAVPDDWEEQPAGRRVLNFACVCALWRSLALSTPRLWTTLRFIADVNPLVGYADRVAMELARTGQASLNLSVNMTPDLSVSGIDARIADVAGNWSDAMWEALCAQSHRWDQVSLHSIPSHAYAHLTHRPFPILRSLSISLDEVDAEVDFPLDAFANAHGITALEVQCISALPQVVLPASWNLTELSVSCGDPEMIHMPPLEPFLDAIAACSSSLRSLTVHGYNFQAAASGDSPIIYPVLESLHLQKRAIALCRTMNAPHLEDVTLEGFLYVGLQILDNLQALLGQSSGCQSLRRLALLEDLETDPASFVACMQRIPQLKELELSHIPGLDIDTDSPLRVAILETLSRDSEVDGANTLLPNLEHLHLDFAGMLNDADDEPELRQAVSEIYISRECRRIVDGQILPPLEWMTTDDEELVFP